jgi:hypothetical protein
MKPTVLFVALLVCGASPALAQTQRMSFFITSAGPGNGADLGGLTGADAHCQMLADAVGYGDRTWRAYLSTTAAGDQASEQPLIVVDGVREIRIRGRGEPALSGADEPRIYIDGVLQSPEMFQSVNARDRIGTGPWYNATGQLIAENVADLHGDNAKWTKQTALNEKGEVVNGRGDTPNRHDILTGSQQDGTAFPPGTDTTCSNWTGSGEGSAQVGHFDKTGGGQNPNSWNSAHASRGCSQENLQGTGGDGLFYCFAIS